MTKLGLKTKKTKKSNKITNLLIKSIITAYWESENFYKVIVQIKGTKISFYKIVDFIKKLSVKYTDIYFIYTPSITHNKHCFKKVRSLKKNFRKKYFKIN